MTLETDLLIDRRRLKRRLFVWRVIAVAAVIACTVLAVGIGGLKPSGAHIARIRIVGVIGEDRKLVDLIRAVAKDTSAKALLLIINSPGGTVGGSEVLYYAIREVAEKKPVVAIMGSVAASGGYMAAVAAPRIYARESTVTGSIGVLMQSIEFSELLGKIGVSAETLTSGPLKDQPSEFHRLSDSGRTVLRGLVMDLYDQFIEKVAVGRNMEPGYVRELADGRVYSGRQALKLKLIDAIGGESDARTWLAIAKDIPETVEVREIEKLNAWERLVGEAADGVFGGVLKSLLSQRLNLDGPMAIWQSSDIKQ